MLQALSGDTTANKQPGFYYKLEGGHPIGCSLRGQRSKSQKVGFTVITPPHYGVSLPFQQGQTFVLADLASKGHSRVLLLLRDPGQIAGIPGSGDYGWAHVEKNMAGLSQQKREGEK